MTACQTRLFAAVLAGQVLFTLAWSTAPLVLAGYRPDEESVSVIAAHGSPNPLPMTLGMAAGMVSLISASVLAWSIGYRLLSTTLGCLATTVGLGIAFRDVCEPANARWCAVPPNGSFPLDDSVHAISANVGIALIVALPVVALVTNVPGRLSHAVGVFASATAAGINVLELKGVTNLPIDRGVAIRLVLVVGSVYVVVLAFVIFVDRSLAERADQPPPEPPTRYR